MLITEKDVKFKAVRPGGSGGQRANRRSTKVQLWIKVNDLPISDWAKRIIRKKLVHHINRNDEIEVWSEEERSQKMNRVKAILKLNELIKIALALPKIRIPTEPLRSAENKRIFEKKIKSDKKRARRMSK